MYVYMYVFMYVYVYVLCMCICVCIYVCMYVYVFMWRVVVSVGELGRMAVNRATLRDAATVREILAVIEAVSLAMEQMVSAYIDWPP